MFMDMNVTLIEFY